MEEPCEQKYDEEDSRVSVAFAPQNALFACFVAALLAVVIALASSRRGGAIRD